MSQKIDTAVAEVVAFDEAKKGPSPCSKFHCDSDVSRDNMNFIWFNYTFKRCLAIFSLNHFEKRQHFESLSPAVLRKSILTIGPRSPTRSGRCWRSSRTSRSVPMWSVKRRWSWWWNIWRRQRSGCGWWMMDDGIGGSKKDPIWRYSKFW